MDFIQNSFSRTGGLVLLCLLLSFPGTACDICGCANSGSYFGLMPQSHKSMIGLRYQYLRFKTHPDSPLLRTEETFNVMEVYGRFYPVKRVQVMAFVPYRIDKQVTSALTKRNDGLGDITVLANYNLFNTLMDKATASEVTHTLLVGGGIKLPTGKFRYDENDQIQVANANFQPGTGSTDFILNAFNTLNWSGWGLSTNLSGKFNTTNSNGYRFGNQVYGTADLYRSFEIGRFTLTPAAGLYGEYAGHGRQHNTVLDITGGTILNASAGLSLFTDRWMLGITGQAPVFQKSSSGHVFSKGRGLVQLAWLF